ncbi:MAG: ribosome small subunit-dependent GTPase A [Chlamydiota bacterium]
MKDDVYRMEEDFHGNDRKTNRKDRKIAIAKDRSKYKKSDQDQLKKRLPTTLSHDENLMRGRVLSIRPEGIFVESDGTMHKCMLKGSMKLDKGLLKNLIAIGDFVRFTHEGIILVIEERHSLLSRADNLSQRKEQLIAVNIDQVLITMSVVFPALKPPLIDRYIIAAIKGNMQPVLIINKIDLLTNDTPVAEQEKILFKEVIATYTSLNIPVFAISIKTGEGLDALKQAMQGKSSVFSGQSGVGKSSLINAIFGTRFLTGDMVGKTNKGSHTTTVAELLPIEGGGFCIDTPGIKSFGMWDLDRNELKNYFKEMQDYAPHCRFLNCAHLEEPGCAVKKAVNEGKISILRFESYCALMANLAEEHRHR